MKTLSKNYEEIVRLALTEAGVAPSNIYIVKNGYKVPLSVGEEYMMIQPSVPGIKYVLIKL